MKRVKWFALFFFAACILACSSTGNRESAGEFLDSSATTTRVKATLVNELGTNGLAIQVRTFKDEVQLSGFVKSQQIRQRAGDIANSLEGVRIVRNDIIVR